MRKQLGGLVDLDYVDTLSESEQQYILDFIKEYYFAKVSKTKLHTPEQLANIKNTLKSTYQDIFVKGAFDVINYGKGNKE